jgi:hypothetical protein
LLQQTILLGNNPNWTLIRQTGVGKFNAVLEGVSTSNYDFIAIWDGDNTINSLDQEKLIKMFLEGDPRKSFLTANRMNSQIEKGAIRSINLLGNFIFSKLVGLAFNKHLPDVLAGTKIFPKYILDESFGCKDGRGFDPFGDIYIIAMATKAKLDFQYLDCQYETRFYGTTNIKRWSGGFALLKAIMHFKFHKCAT